MLVMYVRADVVQAIQLLTDACAIFALVVVAVAMSAEVIQAKCHCCMCRLL